jgi:hypothetical protein
LTALTAGRNTPARYDGIEHHPIKGGVTIFPGALVVLDPAGWAMPGQPGVGLKSVGRSDSNQVSATTNGERAVRTRRGRFSYANSAGADTITRADIGNSAYVVDDQTVAKTSGSATRSVAGIIRDVDAQGVWVEI